MARRETVQIQIRRRRTCSVASDQGLYSGMLSDTDFAENHSAVQKTDFYSAAWKFFFPIFRFCQKPKLVFRSALWMNLPVSFVLVTFLSQQTLILLARLNKVHGELLYYPGVSVGVQMLKFYIKVFRTSLFPNPWMDLVYIWYDDRYCSKIVFSTIPTPMHNLKVKVTDLELLC